MQPYSQSNKQNNRVQMHTAIRLPTYELVQEISKLNEDNAVHYDRKCHVLTIDDYQIYSEILFERLHRSAPSFEKQLRMLGFKKRRVNNTDSSVQAGNKQKIIYYWKGNKEQLIQHQIIEIEHRIHKKLEQTEKFKNNIFNQKKQLDQELQLLIFQVLTQSKYGLSSNIQKKIGCMINKIKTYFNSLQKESKQVTDETLNVLSRQLQLHRLIVFKDHEKPI